MNTFELYTQLTRYLFPKTKNNGIDEIRNAFSRKDVTTPMDLNLERVSKAAINDLESFNHFVDDLNHLSVQKKRSLKEAFCSNRQIENCKLIFPQAQSFIFGELGGTSSLMNLANGEEGAGTNSTLFIAIMFSYLFLSENRLREELKEKESKIGDIRTKRDELSSIAKNQESFISDVRELLKESPFKRHKKKIIKLFEQYKKETEKEIDKQKKSLGKANAELESKSKEINNQDDQLRALLDEWLETLLGKNNKPPLDDSDILHISNDDEDTIESVPCRLFITALTAIFRLAAKPDKESDIKLAFNMLFKSEYSSYFEYKKILRETEKILYYSITNFIPRGTDTVRSLTDLYVKPDFELGLIPAKSLRNGANVLITGASGLGKSTYASALTACILDKTVINSGKEKDLSKDLDIDFQGHVFLLSSKMIRSYLPNSKKDDDIDFIQLFFQKIKDHLNQTNYYYDGEAGSQLNKENLDFPFIQNCDLSKNSILDSIRSFTKQLSKTGRLLIVLDAFDEIPSSSREKYYQMLEKTKSNYPDAIYLITSRQLSEETMNKLKNHWESITKMQIQPFNTKQQEELLKNWRAVLGKEKDKKYDELESFIKTNRYASKFASNPFMLSTLATIYTETNSIQGIIRRAVRQFENICKQRFSNDNRFLFSFDRELPGILKELSILSLKDSSNGIDKQAIIEVLSDKVDSTCDQNELVDDFVAGTGIIVPLEYCDDRYTFINKSIPYELASQLLVELLRKNKDGFKEDGFKKELSDIFRAKENYEILDPLLCAIGISEESIDFVQKIAGYLKDRYGKVSDEDKTAIRQAVRWSYDGNYDKNKSILSQDDYNNNCNYMEIRSAFKQITG